MTRTRAPVSEHGGVHVDPGLAGLIAAAFALSVSELLSAVASDGSSLIISVGRVIVETTPRWLKEWAISAFGSYDKAILLGGIVIVSLALGFLVGRLTDHRRWWAYVGFGVPVLIAILAARQDPLWATPQSTLVSIVAGAAGVAAVLVLVIPSAALQGSARQSGSGDSTRRGVLQLAGAIVAATVLGMVAARSFMLWTSRTGALVHDEVLMPEPANRVERVPAAAVLEPNLLTPSAAERLTPIVTPMEDFYRVDTALVVPQIELAEWKLRIRGMVTRPLELSYGDLLSMSLVESYATLACVSNEVGGRLVGNAKWLGVPLRRLLDRAGASPDATQIVGRSVDGFTTGFPTATAYDGRTAMVVVGANGKPLPWEHGFPARLIVAGLYGYVSATKWLSEIELATWDDFDAYWASQGWAKEGPVKTQSRIDVPRAGGRLGTGPQPVAGVAWAGNRSISQVEVQIDGGDWQHAETTVPLSQETWVQWFLPWNATPGNHSIRVRATDGLGATQIESFGGPFPDGATGYHGLRVRVDDV